MMNTALARTTALLSFLSSCLAFGQITSVHPVTNRKDMPRKLEHACVSELLTLKAASVNGEMYVCHAQPQFENISQLAGPLAHLAPVDNRDYIIARDDAAQLLILERLEDIRDLSRRIRQVEHGLLDRDRSESPDAAEFFSNARVALDSLSEAFSAHQRGDWAEARLEGALEKSFALDPVLKAAIPSIIHKVRPRDPERPRTGLFTDEEIRSILFDGIEAFRQTLNEATDALVSQRIDLEIKTEERLAQEKTRGATLNPDPNETRLSDVRLIELLASDLVNSSRPDRIERLLKLSKTTLSGEKLTPATLASLLDAGRCILQSEQSVDAKHAKKVVMGRALWMTMALPVSQALGWVGAVSSIIASGSAAATAFGPEADICDDIARQFAIQNESQRKAIETNPELRGDIAKKQLTLLKTCGRNVLIQKALVGVSAATAVLSVGGAAAQNALKASATASTTYSARVLLRLANRSQFLGQKGSFALSAGSTATLAATAFEICKEEGASSEHCQEALTYTGLAAVQYGGARAVRAATRAPELKAMPEYLKYRYIFGASAPKVKALTPESTWVDVPGKGQQSPAALYNESPLFADKPKPQITVVMPKTATQSPSGSNVKVSTEAATMYAKQNQGTADLVTVGDTDMFEYQNPSGTVKSLLNMAKPNGQVVIELKPFTDLNEPRVSLNIPVKKLSMQPKIVKSLETWLSGVKGVEKPKIWIEESPFPGRTSVYIVLKRTGGPVLVPSLKYVRPAHDIHLTKGGGGIIEGDTPTNTYVLDND